MNRIITRGYIYFAFAFASALFSSYCFYQATVNLTSANLLTERFVFGGIGVVFLLVAALHMIYSIGHLLGSIDGAEGAKESATLTQNGIPIVKGKRVYFVICTDSDNASLTDEEKIVFFVCNWRPWSCKKSEYRVG